MVRTIPNRNYKYGTVDTLEPQSIPRGASSGSLNWLTKGDHIELRRGHAYLGTSSVNSGLGRATCIKKAVDALGIEHLFGTYGKKLKYFDRDTLEWVENGTDLLGSNVVDANGIGKEPVFMSDYTSPAGNQLWACSMSAAGLFKIMVSNPGSSADQYNSAKNFKGLIKIDTNRMLLWGRKEDKTGLYGSYIDEQNYTTVSGEAITGPSFTLAFKGGGSKRTCFGVSLTIGAITYTDDYAGNLIASSGANGTINYTTGEVAGVASAAGTASYQWEDSTNNGIADFTKSATRVAGEGFVFRQDEGGGALKAVGVYSQLYYCFHIKKTWDLDIGADDTTATNLPYREKVGASSARGIVETGDGIYYVDETSGNDTRIRILQYDTSGSAKVIPVQVSANINLNDYLFDEAAGIEFGELILIACATSNSTTEVDGQTVPSNNRTLVYNTTWKSWDVLDYAISCFDVYDGALVGGGATSDNFFELFSGVSDPDDADIANFWEGDLDDLDQDGLSKVKGIKEQGFIGPDQKIKVSVSVDRGPFVEVGGSDDPDTGVHTYAIEGSGSYVDRTNRVSIGPATLGRTEIGGGGDGIEAYNFERIIPLRLDKGELFRVRYEAVGIGAAGISGADWWDVRGKGQKLPRKYRT